MILLFPDNFIDILTDMLRNSHHGCVQTDLFTIHILVAGLDYTAVNRILDFSPGEMTKTLQVAILDDLGQPRLEGVEKFELVLRMPMGGSLGEPSVSVVSINDSLSDSKLP